MGISQQVNILLLSMDDEIDRLKENSFYLLLVDVWRICYAFHLSFCLLEWTCLIIPCFHTQILFV